VSSLSLLDCEGCRRLLAGRATAVEGRRGDQLPASTSTKGQSKEKHKAGVCRS